MRLDLKNSPPRVPLSARKLNSSPPKRRRSRELFIFLVFVLLSATFWFVQSLQRRFTYTLHIPVVYDSIPPEVGMQTKLPEYIEVSLEDEGGHLLEYTLVDWRLSAFACSVIIRSSRASRFRLLPSREKCGADSLHQLVSSPSRPLQLMRRPIVVSARCFRLLWAVCLR